MRKTKLLALTLVVALMMVGAGYAYWTQELTIQNEISTGNLDVIFANQDLDLSEAEYMADSTFVPAANDGEHNLVLNLEKAYPGADIKLSFDLDNEGTLGAHVRDFELLDDTRAELVFVRKYKIGNNTVTVSGDKTLAAVLSDLNTYGTFDQGIFVEKDQAVNVVFELEIDPAANAELPQGEPNAIEFTIKGIAHQYNDIQ